MMPRYLWAYDLSTLETRVSTATDLTYFPRNIPEISFNVYTPGQKFIEFFFNELSHQNDEGNPQFVNSGMETHHISTNL